MSKRSDNTAADANPTAHTAQPPTPRWKRWLPLVAIAALAIALVASGVWQQLNIETLARHYDTLHAWVSAHPVLAGLGMIVCMVVLLSSGLPGAVVFVLGGGLFFGTVIGGLLASVANMIGATVLYLAAKRFFASGAKPPPLVEKIRAGFDAAPASYAFFIRLVPVFPFGAVSVALAWLGCRLPLFLVSAFVGGMPGTMVYAAIGAGLGGTIRERQDFELSILSEPRFAVPLIGLAVLALIPAVVQFVRRRKDRKVG